MDTVFSVSIVASFFAGMVALFAPCCITVLLPAYMAAAFKEKKNVLKMTFIFFLGISAILVPIGLGAASMANLFRRFHNEMYIIGGLFMVFLGVMSFFGKGMSILPMRMRSPNLDVTNFKSVFLLGVFSGAATSCCAPVLFGAVTLAVLSGSFLKALAVTFSYVFGMTFPLFITAYWYDKFNIGESKIIVGKILQVKVFGKKWFLHSTNLLAASIFILVGAMLFYLGFSHNAFWSPSYQSRIGLFLNSLANIVVERMSFIPNSIWAIAIFLLFALWLRRALKNAKKSEK